MQPPLIYVETISIDDGPDLKKAQLKLGRSMQPCGRYQEARSPFSLETKKASLWAECADQAVRRVLSEEPEVPNSSSGAPLSGKGFRAL